MNGWVWVILDEGLKIQPLPPPIQLTLKQTLTHVFSLSLSCSLFWIYNSVSLPSLLLSQTLFLSFFLSLSLILSDSLSLYFSLILSLSIFSLHISLYISPFHSLSISISFSLVPCLSLSLSFSLSLSHTHLKSPLFRTVWRTSLFH